MEDSGEQTRKLFLGGLNYATNEEGLTTYFSQWGTLVDCVVMRFPDSRRSRGFGFITYSSVDEADACFEAGPHTLDGTKVDLKRATPKDEKSPAGPKGEVLRKIFVGGLNYNTTDEGLRTYFEQFGEVVDSIVMKYKDSDRSRGFGFVTYSSTDIVDIVQQNRPHTIDGTKVETKRATPREDSAKGESGKTVKKIFVGGLKDEISDEDLKSYFSQFGEVVSAEQMVDKASGRKRGFGFVEFDDYDPVDKAILVPRHEINGLKVDIRKALGRNELGGGGMKDGGYGGGRGGGRGPAPWGGAQGGYGGGYGDAYSGGYGSGGGWGGNQAGYGSNPWQTGGSAWGDQSSAWSGTGAGYMSSGGGWGGGYGSGNAGMSGGAGGAMRNSMMGGAGNRTAPYTVGGRGGGGGGGAGRGGMGGGRGGAVGGAPRW